MTDLTGEGGGGNRMPISTVTSLIRGETKPFQPRVASRRLLVDQRSQRGQETVKRRLVKPVALSPSVAAATDRAQGAAVALARALVHESWVFSKSRVNVRRQPGTHAIVLHRGESAVLLTYWRFGIPAIP